MAENKGVKVQDAQKKWMESQERANFMAGRTGTQI